MNAGFSVTTGNQNTLIGCESADNLTTGNDNIIIGFAAGAHAVNLSTGSNNVLIGSFSDTTASDTSNANVIGADVSGAGNFTTIGLGTSDSRLAHGGTTWLTVSDERYKKDITDSTLGLSFINALRPRTFNYKTLGQLPETFRAYVSPDDTKQDSTEIFKSNKTQHGFIAQEVKAAIDADSGAADGFRLWAERDDGSQEVGEAALIPVLVKAIQELTARVAALES